MCVIKTSPRTNARGASERLSILFSSIRAIRVFRIAKPVSNIILRELCVLERTRAEPRGAGERKSYGTHFTSVASLRPQQS